MNKLLLGLAGAVILLSTGTAMAQVLTHEPRAGTLAQGECVVVKVHPGICAKGLQKVCGAPNRHTSRTRFCAH